MWYWDAVGTRRTTGRAHHQIPRSTKNQPYDQPNDQASHSISCVCEGTCMYSRAYEVFHRAKRAHMHGKSMNKYYHKWDVRNKWPCFPPSNFLGGVHCVHIGLCRLCVFAMENRPIPGSRWRCLERPNIWIISMGLKLDIEDIKWNMKWNKWDLRMVNGLLEISYRRWFWFFGLFTGMIGM